MHDAAWAAKFHTRTLPSLPPLAIVSPSGAYAMESTTEVCPARTSSALPDPAASHSRIILSSPALAKIPARGVSAHGWLRQTREQTGFALESGEKASAQTPSMCPEPYGWDRDTHLSASRYELPARAPRDGLNLSRMSNNGAVPMYSYPAILILESSNTCLSHRVL